MWSVIQHDSGQIYSIKTFRPLLIFPWTSSIWRQSPFRTAIATVSYPSKAAAEQGHEELEKLIKALKIGPKMDEPFGAIDAFARKRAGDTVKSHRIYSGHDVEGKVSVQIESSRKRRD